MERPTKTQQRLLEFIAAFVIQHGYGPSYREIMRALDYKSVSTVAVHVDGLIARGLLRKNGRSARSLEVLTQPKVTVATVNPEEWLQLKVTQFAKSNRADKAALKTIAQGFEHLGLIQLKQLTEKYLKADR